MTRAKVVVLGATGFVGRNVRDRLALDGHEVHGLSRTGGCDLLDLPAAWRQIEHLRPDYIVNCAAFVGSVNFVSDFAADVVDVNMRMLLNTYKIAQQMREAVLINPIANCGFPGGLDVYREGDLWDGPLDPSVKSYGATRRMIDVLADCYRRQYGVRSANLFVPNMYGPYDSHNPNKTHALNALVIKFVTAAKSGAEEVEIWGTGRPVREWLYVKDLARLVSRVVSEGGFNGEPVSVAQNHGLSVDEIAALIAERVGFKGRLRRNTSYGDGSPRKVMDDTLFRGRFPDFTFTPMDQGLEETVAYYRGTIA